MSQLGFGNSFGFIGKDYALVASDAAVPRSIVTMKAYDDKIQQVASRTLFALTGDVGDRYVISDVTMSSPHSSMISKM